MWLEILKQFHWCVSEFTVGWIFCVLLGIKAGFLYRTLSNWKDLAGFFFNMKSLEKDKTLDLSENQDLTYNWFTQRQDTKLTGLSEKSVLQQYEK